MQHIDALFRGNLPKKEMIRYLCYILFGWLSACHPLLPMPKRGHSMSEVTSEWGTLRNGQECVAVCRIAVEGSSLNTEQNPRGSQNILDRNDRIKIVDVYKVTSFNGDYYNAHCRVLTGMHSGKTLVVTVGPSFFSAFHIQNARANQ